MVYIINKTSNRTRNLSEDDKAKRKKEFFNKKAKKLRKEKGHDADWEKFKTKTEREWRKESPYNS